VIFAVGLSAGWDGGFTAKVVVVGVIAGAFAGNFLWGLVFKRRKPPSDSDTAGPEVRGR
jgi:hypothetical protein